MNVRDLFDTVQEQAEAGVDAASDAAVDGKAALLKALAHAGKLLGSLETDDLLERLGVRAARPSSLVPSVLTFGAGAVVGAVAGVLLAPQSGEQTRAQLASRLDDLLRRLRATSDDLRQDAAHAADQAQDAASDAADQTQDAAARVVEHAKDLAHDVRAGASHLGKAPNGPA